MLRISSILCLILCCCTVRIYGSTGCSNQNYFTNSGVFKLSANNTPCKNKSSSCTNTAYFNFKSAPVQHFASLQTRSTAISLAEADFIKLIQPNMTQTTNYAPTVNLTMDIGNADGVNSQTWTLPANISSYFTKIDNIDFILPTDVKPIAAQDAGATHVGRRKYLDRGGNSVTEYGFYQLNANQPLNELGSCFVDATNNLLANHEAAAQLYAKSPLSLSDNFTNDITWYQDESTYPISEAIENITVDGFGTITNPQDASKSYQCLRLNISETKKVTQSDLSVTSTNLNLIGWVTKEGFLFYVGVPANASHTTSINSLQLTTFSATLTPSPVTLLSFEGVAKNGGTDLMWSTAQEENNQYFNIEKSTDGQTFEKIGQVAGAGTTLQRQTYTFRDENLSQLSYYRLKQFDIDGTFTISNVISVETQNNTSLRIYPNPSTDAVSIDLPEGIETLEVYNSLGSLVFQKNTVGQNSLKFDANTFVSGFYVIHAFDKNNNEVVTSCLVKK